MPNARCAAIATAGVCSAVVQAEQTGRFEHGRRRRSGAVRRHAGMHARQQRDEDGRARRRRATSPNSAPSHHVAVSSSANAGGVAEREALRRSRGG